jgi:hypothetical protein
MAGGVDLDDVHGPTLADRDARLAGVTRLAIVAAVGAVDGLGQDARGGCLARAARPHEQIGVGDAVGHDRVTQGRDDGILAQDLPEALGSPAAIERLVRRADSGFGAV